MFAVTFFSISTTEFSSVLGLRYCCLLEGCTCTVRVMVLSWSVCALYVGIYVSFCLSDALFLRCSKIYVEMTEPMVSTQHCADLY